MTSGIDGTGAAILWSVQVDALRRSVAEIPGYGDGAALEVDVLPLEGAALAPPDAGVDQQMDQGPPFQRLPLQAGDDLLNLCRSIGQRAVCLDFSLPGLWALHLIHRIAVDHVPQVSHLEEAVEDGVDLHDGGVGLALGLNVQQQGGDLCRGDLRELKAAEGWIDPFVQITLIVGTGVLAHGDSLGWHEHPLPVLLQREDFSGLRGLQRLPLPLLGAADDLPSIALALKLSRHRCKLPLDGLPAPAVRRIPPPRQAGLAPAPADADLIKRPPVLSSHFPGRGHILSLPFFAMLFL